MNQNWIPACGGTEKPFTTRTGHLLQYLFCKETMEHAYINVRTDIFIENDTESMTAVGLIF